MNMAVKINHITFYADILLIQNKEWTENPQKNQNSNQWNLIRAGQVGRNEKSHRQFMDIFSQWHHENTVQLYGGKS